jgi:hypothetical protein
MIVQLVVIILVCIAASVFALTLAGVSLSIFAKFLKRSEQASKD